MSWDLFQESLFFCRICAQKSASFQKVCGRMGGEWLTIEIFGGSTWKIYKICDARLWKDVEQAGTFKGAGIDIEDGFIHFSTAAQVRQTAARFFEGRDSLYLIGVDAEKLGDGLKWEPASNGMLFPHLYGSLPMSAVVSQDELLLGPLGSHQFPDGIPA